MARINFEDSIYKNPQYSKLLIRIGCPYKTKGLLLTAWELAQAYWLKHRGVPKDKWDVELNVLIEFGFAETSDSVGFVYVSGSEEYCAFLEKQSKAGKAGGRSRSQKKLQNLRQYSKNTETRPKPDRNLINPTEVSYSYSFSNSFSNSNKNTPDSSNDEPRRVFDFESLYKKYPRKEGKERGLKICKVQIKSQQDFDLLSKAIDAYTENIKKNATDAKYIKHFSTFMASWRDWLDPETGTSLKKKAGIDLWLEMKEKNGNT